jgi:hypothetical protein
LATPAAPLLRYPAPRSAPTPAPAPRTRSGIHPDVARRSNRALADWWAQAEERGRRIQAVCHAAQTLAAGRYFHKINGAIGRKRSITRLRTALDPHCRWLGVIDNTPTWIFFRPREGFYLQPASPSEAQACVAAYRIRLHDDKLACSFDSVETTKHCCRRVLERCDPGIDLDRLLFALHDALANVEPTLDGADFTIDVDPGQFRCEVKAGVLNGQARLFVRAATFLHHDMIPET